MSMEYQTSDEKETAALAASLAQECKSPSLYCLYGDLGAGKSVFARSFIQALTSAEEDVPSPTFTLVQTYDTAKGPLHHFDLYRLEHPEETDELGWDEALSQSIVIVEWPQRLGNLLPPSRIDIHIDVENENTRKITIDDKTN